MMWIICEKIFYDQHNETHLNDAFLEFTKIWREKYNYIWNSDKKVKKMLIYFVLKKKKENSWNWWKKQQLYVIEMDFSLVR